MIKSLIICYIIIVIVQFIITKYTAPNLTESTLALHKKIKYNLEHKDELLKKFSKKVLEIVKPINSGEMKFDEWITWSNTLPPLEEEGNKYYFSIWEHLPDELDNYLLLHYDDPNYVGLTYKDLRDEMTQLAINSKHEITSNSNRYSRETGGIGKVDGFTYYWVDPLSLQSVKRQNVNTAFQAKNGKTGYVSIGVDLENLSYEDSFKYYEHIQPTVLFITSITTISIALVINNLDATKHSNIRAFVFLIISNLYLLSFMNTYETESTPINEILKMERITGSILTFSFLSGVNIYILQSLFDKKKVYFKESAFIFGISIILILMSAYKYDNPDDIITLIKQRITSQLTFNLAVILNSLMLVDFMFYTLSLKNVLIF